MVVREVGAEFVGAGGHRAGPALHENLRPPASDLAECDRAIMATEAHLGNAGRLAYSRFESGALVGGVGHGGIMAVPQRFGRPSVGRVAEDTNFGILLSRRAAGGQAASAAGGEVVL